MRILCFTSLFPNKEQPNRGIFVATRLKQLINSGGVDLHVIAPVPWFPFCSKVFGEYGEFCRIPKTETLDGIRVYHPRYPVIPKFGMSISPLLMAVFCFFSVWKEKSRNDFDLIDAHYYYPDGVAAAIIGKWLNKPVFITARGSDINLIPNYFFPRQFISWAANRAKYSITVSKSLKTKMVELGIDESKITVLRNGVDLELFKPVDESISRSITGINHDYILSVGNLIELKGHHLIIRALKDIKDIILVIIGSGPLKKELKRLASDEGVSSRVVFAGQIQQRDLVYYYSAAKLLVLASSREGMANVILESLACGTPVAVVDSGGSAEIVNNRYAGKLIGKRTPESIGLAIEELLLQPPCREQTRKYAESLSWNNTTLGQKILFNAATNDKKTNVINEHLKNHPKSGR